MGFKKIAPLDKKRITDDWQQLFPSMGIYKPMHLMNRLGPQIVGILLEIKSGSTDYTPKFHVHNLIRSFPTISLSLTTSIDSEYVHLEWHKTKYRELAEKIKKIALIPFDGDLELDKVLFGYIKYLEKPNIPYQPHLYEDMALICGWCGNSDKLNRVLDLAKKEMKKWPQNVLAKIGDLEEWIKTLEKKSNDDVALKKICEKHIIELKVDKLPFRNLLD